MNTNLINYMNEKIKKKKKDEKIIVNKFIEAYKYKYDNNIKFKILETEEVKLDYPNYNGENPDFVLLNDKTYIGIEICNLFRNKLESLNKDNSEKDMKLDNAMHLQDKRKDNKKRPLYLMEDLSSAAIDSINNKVKKVNIYINCPIWLLCYANQPSNLYLLSSYFDDKVENKVGTYISNNILKNIRIEKIWLAEFSYKNLLLEIK
jgi:hypothetical protein